MKNFLDLCNERFAARKFTDEPVSDEDLHYLMESIRLAPSAANRQPWRFLIVRSEEAKRKLRECYAGQWFQSVPIYIIGMKNESTCWVRKEDGKPHADIDLAIATEHFCLAAAERGLGTCWVCHYDPVKLREHFSEEGFEAVVIVPFGHLAADCPRKEKERKASEEIFKEM